MGLVAPRLRATPLLASVPTDPRRRAKTEKSLCGGASKWSHPLGGATFPGGDFGESRCGLCGGASKWSHPLGAGGERGKNRKNKINKFSLFLVRTLQHRTAGTLLLLRRRSCLRAAG